MVEVFFVILRKINSGGYLLSIYSSLNIAVVAYTLFFSRLNSIPKT